MTRQLLADSAARWHCPSPELKLSQRMEGSRRPAFRAIGTRQVYEIFVQVFVDGNLDRGSVLFFTNVFVFSDKSMSPQASPARSPVGPSLTTVNSGEDVATISTFRSGICLPAVKKIGIAICS